MKTLNEIFIRTKYVENLAANAGHDMHVDNYVFGVGDLHTNVRKRRTNGPHTEWDHIHGTAFHRTFEQFSHGLLHLARIDPVVGRSGVFAATAADKRTVFD